MAGEAEARTREPPDPAPVADSVRAGLDAARPVFLPMFLIGCSFGIAARSAGWGVVAPVVMSLLTLGGAAQLAVLATLTAGGTVVAAVIAGVLINLRFLAVGIAIGPSLSGGWLRRFALGQTLLDVSLVLARTGPARFGERRLLGSTIPQWLGWQVGTLAGVLCAGLIDDPRRFGIDALFPAFFLVLLMAELRDPWVRPVALAAAAIAVVCIPLTAPGVPVIAACGAVLIALVRR